MKDSQGNPINVTLFESYFSKFLIEHPEWFKPVYLKILSAIQTFQELNKNNKEIDRSIYAIDTLMSQVFIKYNTIQSLIDNFDLFAVNYYLKLFCDQILTKNLKANYNFLDNEANDQSKIPSLFILCQHSLFNSKTTKNKPHTYLKSPYLFDSQHRGVQLIDDDTIIMTKKLGITPIEETPNDLKSYFAQEYEPSQCQYIPDRKSNVGKWFTNHNLPIISGSSGSARDYLSHLFKIVNLEHTEVKLLILSLAATLIAKGHHSYFEVMIIMDRFGYKLKNTPDLFTFYEQTLPELIRSNKEYIAFIHSDVGEKLLKNVSFKVDDPSDFKDLPHISIG